MIKLRYKVVRDGDVSSPCMSCVCAVDFWSPTHMKDAYQYQVTLTLVDTALPHNTYVLSLTSGIIFAASLCEGYIVRDIHCANCTPMIRVSKLRSVSRVLRLGEFVFAAPRRGWHYLRSDGAKKHDKRVDSVCHALILRCENALRLLTRRALEVRRSG